MTLFLMVWWNKALGGSTEGWFQHYADLVWQGRVPYLDFYLFTPPGHLLETLALSKFFGLDYMVFRWFGLIQRLLMCVILFVWLVRYFHPFFSFLGATLCMLAYSCDGPDVLFYVNHSTALWSLLACWMASHLDTRSKAWFAWVIAAGFFAGINCLVKQTTGLGISMLIPVAWLIMGWRSPWQARLKLALPCYGLAWGIPILGALLWMNSQGAWHAFIEQVFVRGTSSKGPLVDTLFRPFSPFPTAVLYGVLVYLFWRLSGFYLKKYKKWEVTPTQSLSPRFQLVGGVVSGGMSFGGVLVGLASP
ncbi:MAG: hypothetical protein HC904_03805 [Blastochloris sp.]|nr:hypothetical protein [Blastochloris sp.]